MKIQYLLGRKDYVCVTAKNEETEKKENQTLNFERKKKSYFCIKGSSPSCYKKKVFQEKIDVLQFTIKFQQVDFKNIFTVFSRKN